MVKFLKISSLLALLILFYSGASAQSTFPGERLEQACKEYAYGLLGSSAEISVLQDISDQRFSESGVTASCTGNTGSLRGMSSIGVEFRKNGMLLRRINVAVRVRIYGTAPVAGRSLQSGTVLSKSDIEFKKVELTDHPAEDIPHISELTGAKIAQSLPKDAVITRSALAMEMTIARGDKVVLLVKSGAVQIKTEAYAMEDAKSGETVKVKYDGATLSGKVALDGTVILSKN